MKRSILLIPVIFLFFSCDPATVNRTLETVLGPTDEVTDSQINSGLKEALIQGTGKGVEFLSSKDGFFKSQYKILLPPEARKVTDKLQQIPGFTQVEDIILEKINRGAEDAVSRAKPIFVDAIRSMSFRDVRDILFGPGDAATNYLVRTTSDELYQEFNPVIISSLDKFNARDYWADAVNTYNKIPFTGKVNPDLDDYVTREALDGLFSLVEKEERNIRDNIAARTTNLLRRVFGLQDK